MRDLHMIQGPNVTRDAREKIAFFAFHAFVVEDSRFQQNRVRAKLYNCSACVCKSNVEIRIAGSFCRPQLLCSRINMCFLLYLISSYLDIQCLCVSLFSSNNSSSATELFIELMCNFCELIIWLKWSAMKRRILIGSLSAPKFALQTAQELISAIFFFNSLHIINNLLVNRNLFTHISAWKAIQLNVQKSDARKVSKCRER